MGWFNVFGTIIIAIIMIPNIVFAIKCMDGFQNKYQNKVVEMVEQIGRYGCFVFMIFNIPGTVLGWYFDNAIVIYKVVDIVLVLLYCIIWIVCFNKNNMFRALALSVIPSVLFFFSGVVSLSIPLIVASLLFAPSHILLSYKNAK